MEVSGLLGTLDPAAVAPVVERHWRTIEDCFTRGRGAAVYIGGRLIIGLRIGVDGAVRSARVAGGDLGAWPVERCVLAAARSWKFPRPRGGEAEVSVPLELPARAAALADASKLAERALAVRLLDLRPCLKGGSEGEGVYVTAYVAPGGVVTSAGFAPVPENDYNEAWADCAHEKMLKWKLPDPRGSVWKVHGRYPRP